MMSKRRFLNTIGLGGVGALLAACNRLTLFNAFTPKEKSVHRIATDVAYGSKPRQTYDVYAPVTGSHLPVLVFFYGGNWASGSKSDYNWMGHALAAMGYVVALPDYRLVPEVHYPDFVSDCALAAKHIAQHAGDYGGDGSRLALSGQSAGAYNAAMVTLDPEFRGDLDIKAFVGISGPYDFYPFNVPASANAFGQYPRPTETQPITYARKVDTHILLMQSRADTIVGTHNAVNLEARLKAAGTDVRLKLYDGLSHQDTAAVFSLPFRGKGTLYNDVKVFLAEVV
ncbi:MAG TPA: alpha/beta hydrolase [Asticcacaulis sp.]|nr:alpha/beta hydrolase [Asticcacaulis sp.]